METLFSVKNNSEIAERSLSTSREISRSRARLTAINETIIISPTVDESVFTEVIEKFSREAQLTISDMADEIRRLKRSLEISEAELQE